MATPSEGAGTSSLRVQVEQLLDLYGDGVAPIVQSGDPVLRSVAGQYEGQLEDEVLAALVELMRRTMYAAPGVGLAAPQIGLPVQLAVIEDSAAVSEEIAESRERYPQEFLVIVNPTYTPSSLRTADFPEGCLSVTGYHAVVRRHADVTLRYTDLGGTSRLAEFSGWPARIVQHETDHLNGILYVDKAEPGTLTEIVDTPPVSSQ
ncbi:peptide deformylase [Nocardia sp. NPDC051756]|uniref:peptide deformylase n=1 Tax=Nocardia sp. NPDC051756 TaxID=3154751 RepID=UPI00343F50C1